MAKKNILVLASTFPRWKEDTSPPFVFELEKRLTSKFNIYVLAPHSKGAQKSEVWENLIISRFQYFWPDQLQKLCYEGGILPNIKKNKFLIFQGVTLLFFELVSAMKIIKKERIELIHAHWIIPQGIIALILNKVFNIPYIITTHGGDIYGLQNSILVRIKKSILKNASEITVVSNDIKDEIHKKIDSDLDIEVVSMGVDSSLFNPNKKNINLYKKYSDNGPLLLFVGRLVEKKGVEYLLQAMPKILSKLPSSRLIIVGEGSLKNNLEEIVKNKKLENAVTFIGPVNNKELPKYYASSDIFIGPSIMTDDGDTEGLGLTFIEASMSECVPVGSRVGGITDVIQENKTGLLVEEKNPDDIADKIISILENKNFAHQLRKNARNFSIVKYDWKIVAQKYASIYQTI